MNKKQAAQYLGFSVKNLERLMALRKIQFSYVHAKFGKTVDFDLQDLDAYKASLDIPKVVISPAIVQHNISSNPNNLDTFSNHSLSNDNKDNLVIPTKDLQDLTSILLKISHSLDIHLSQSFVPLDKKLTLSLSEASLLAGLSTSFLRNSIRLGHLIASKRGNSWNIKRSDLDTFITSL